MNFQKPGLLFKDFSPCGKKLLDAICASDSIAGFCYTQLADVEQETNGLLTCDRVPKIRTEIIRKINDRVNKKRRRI